MSQLQHTSQWRGTTSTQSLACADTLPAAVDVAIVGAGIAGMTAAVLLARAKKRVVVLEMGSAIGAGDTGQTTAHITCVPDAGYATVLKNFGPEGAKTVAEAHMAAVETIASLVKSCHIDCDFRRVPFYMYGSSEDEISVVHDALQAMREAGLSAESCDTPPLPFAVKAGLMLPNQAQFQPLAYLAGLAQELQRQGGVVCTNTRMKSRERKADRWEVTTDRGKLSAHDLVFATHAPPNKLALHMKLAPQLTYAMSFRCKNLPPAGLYYDTNEPYHYIRRHPYDSAGDLLIVGGCDHRTGGKTNTEQSFVDLEKYARAHWPVDDAVFRWSGQIFEPADGLPFIGANPGTERNWVITGLSGNGMASGTLGGMICSERVQDKPSIWGELFAPSRIKPIAQAVDSAKHNVEVSTHMVADRVKAWLHTQKIAPRDGAVMREGAHAVAAYNDGHQVHVLSPVCPHAGCYVQFNRAEQCWDCPCHGSRFAGDGRLMCGPAVSDLERFEHRPAGDS